MSRKFRPRAAIRRTLAICLLASLAGCSRAGGSALEAQRTADTDAPVIETRSQAEEQPTGELAAQIDGLRRGGRFEEFIDAALNADEASPDAALDLLRVEAYLASGRILQAEAAALAAAERAFAAGQPSRAAQALKLWAIARLRGGQPFDVEPFHALWAQLPADDPTALMLGYWREALAGAAPFAIDVGAGPSRSVVPVANAAAGSVAEDLVAIEATANGVRLPVVFIDTGAQHCLMTLAAARAAGVRIGPETSQLVGFAGLTARVGLISSLKLGELEVRNVPVLVGDYLPLVANGGQMHLGTELMHHVRFTIDYPRRQVTAEPARIASLASPPAEWEIPLWTFSQVALTIGETGDGHLARVLVDTGNRTGTFVSHRWAESSAPGYRPPSSSMVFKFRSRHWMLGELSLGNQTLARSRVHDTLPADLERLDLVDVLLGRDTLAAYEVTIDLAQRVLRLRGEAPVPPAPDLPNE